MQGEATVKIHIENVEHITSLHFTPTTRSTTEEPLNETLECMREVYQRVNAIFTENLKAVKAPVHIKNANEEDEDEEDENVGIDVPPPSTKKQKTKKR